MNDWDCEYWKTAEQNEIRSYFIIQFVSEGFNFIWQKMGIFMERIENYDYYKREEYFIDR